MTPVRAPRGFTLIELLTALLILSLLALLSYRGLDAVLEARARVGGEAAKWRHVAAFFQRFERDVDMASPRRVRGVAASSPAWLGRSGAARGPLLEFSRFASVDGTDAPRRVGYRLNERGQIELWIWPGLDLAPGAQPARYAVLSGVTKFQVEYMNVERAWLAAWPASPRDAAIPRAVRVTVLLASGESIMRVFALGG